MNSQSITNDGQAPSVSVIIPNWNGKRHLQVCLESLDRQSYRHFEVILVDNDSTDGSQAFVREHFPEVVLVELEENLGFTGACIAGYEASNGEYIILLNNDTETDPDWLSEIIGAFNRQPRTGIVASKMMLFDRRDFFHTAGDYYRIDGIP